MSTTLFAIDHERNGLSCTKNINDTLVMDYDIKTFESQYARDNWVNEQLGFRKVIKSSYVTKKVSGYGTIFFITPEQARSSGVLPPHFEKQNVSETTMRTGLTYNVFEIGADAYQIAAIIDINEVACRSNLHFVSDVYDNKNSAETVLDRILCDNLQAGEVQPMRMVTKHCDHIYKSSFLAMRAAKNAIGDFHKVSEVELEDRFSGRIKITEPMIAVEAYENGWRWSYTYNLSDVLVNIKDKQGLRKEMRFADVCHWPDFSTPIADPLQGIGILIGRHEAKIEQEKNLAFPDSEKSMSKAFPVDITSLLALTTACAAHGFQADNVVRCYNAVRRNIETLETGGSLEDTTYWLKKAETLGMNVSTVREQLETGATNCIESSAPRTPSDSHNRTLR